MQRWIQDQNVSSRHPCLSECLVKLPSFPWSQDHSFGCLYKPSNCYIDGNGWMTSKILINNVTTQY